MFRLCLHLLQPGGKTQEIFHLIPQQAIAHPVGKAPVGAFQDAVQPGMKRLQGFALMSG